MKSSHLLEAEIRSLGIEKRIVINLKTGSIETGGRLAHKLLKFIAQSKTLASNTQAG